MGYYEIITPLKSHSYDKKSKLLDKVKITHIKLFYLLISTFSVIFRLFVLEL